jgi:hypothetical protein
MPKKNWHEAPSVPELDQKKEHECISATTSLIIISSINNNYSFIKFIYFFIYLIFFNIYWGLGIGPNPQYLNSKNVLININYVF